MEALALGETNNEDTEDITILGLNIVSNFQHRLALTDKRADLVRGQVHTCKGGKTLDTLDIIDLEGELTEFITLVCEVSNWEGDLTTKEGITCGLLTSGLGNWHDTNNALCEVSWSLDCVPFLTKERVNSTNLITRTKVLVDAVVWIGPGKVRWGWGHSDGGKCRAKETILASFGCILDSASHKCQIFVDFVAFLINIDQAQLKGRCCCQEVGMSAPSEGIDVGNGYGHTCRGMAGEGRRGGIMGPRKIKDCQMSPIYECVLCPQESSTFKIIPRMKITDRDRREWRSWARVGTSGAVVG